VVTGNSGGTWIIDPAEPQLISQGGEISASATVVLANDLLLDLIEGRKNPLEAYEEGKLQVVGDLNVAFEFGRVLFA
jgi:putative sterol carrier protein